MDYVFWGQIAFILLAALGWLIFWMFVNYWKEKEITPWVVTSVYVFPYFLLGFFIFFILALVVQYGGNVIH
jgi:hypothetical protein